MKLLIRLITGITPILWFTLPAAEVPIHLLPQPVIYDRMARVPDAAVERRAQLEEMFRAAGCEGEFLTTLPVPHSRQPDLICRLPGQDPVAGVIVVGAHQDHVSIGIGAVDDWSGAALLPSLYETLKTRTRRHDFVFVEFAAEETGLNGSREYVRRVVKQQRLKVAAMINLECLGLSSPAVWASRADKVLLADYGAVAKSLGLTVHWTNVDDVGDDDSHPFRDARVPVLTMHSLTTENFPILHSARDEVKAIRPDDYYAAYRMAATYLGYLDTAL